MDKLQRAEVTLRESKLWFRAIFNRTFGFIGLMEPIRILIEGNQMALKFGEITNSKVIHRPLWRACWSDFSRDMEALSLNLFPFRGEALNFRLTFVGKFAQGLGLLVNFPHTVKSQAQWWTIPKRIQAQRRRVIIRASR